MYSVEISWPESHVITKLPTNNDCPQIFLWMAISLDFKENIQFSILGITNALKNLEGSHGLWQQICPYEQFYRIIFQETHLIITVPTKEINHIDCAKYLVYGNKAVTLI